MNCKKCANCGKEFQDALIIHPETCVWCALKQAERRGAERARERIKIERMKILFTAMHEYRDYKWMWEQEEREINAVAASAERKSGAPKEKVSGATARRPSNPASARGMSPPSGAAPDDGKCSCLNLWRIKDNKTRECRDCGQLYTWVTGKRMGWRKKGVRR